MSVHLDNREDSVAKSLEMVEKEIISIESSTKEVSSLLDLWLPQTLTHKQRWIATEKSRRRAAKEAKDFFKVAQTACTSPQNEEEGSAHDSSWKETGLELKTRPTSDIKNVLEQGWLWIGSSTPKIKRWISLLKDRILWSDGQHMNTNGLISLHSVKNVKKENLSIVIDTESSRDMPPIGASSLLPPVSTSRRVALSAETAPDAARWFAAIRAAWTRTTSTSAAGLLLGYDLCTPGEVRTMPLPVLDDDATTRERAVRFHVRVGQAVDEGATLCHVECRRGAASVGSGGGSPTAGAARVAVRAPCGGTVSRLFCERTDRRTGDALVTQGRPLIAITTEPRWDRKFTLPPPPTPAPAPAARSTPPPTGLGEARRESFAPAAAMATRYSPSVLAAARAILS
jgi:hypothetical protein